MGTKKILALLAIGISMSSYQVHSQSAEPPTKADIEKMKKKEITFTGITGTDAGDLDVSHGNDLIKKINEKIKKDQLTNGEKVVNYRLDTNAFIVNNQKQLPEIHQKYKREFLQKKSWIISYNYKLDTKTVTPK
ncbi:hypothetical protein [Ascidiimonas aurantiaca]|uniref:hypothetical protein n=1 Tax=Ascidiimonas aurantiaca TaxID=1685432 RepID=UPI0030EC26AC